MDRHTLRERITAGDESYAYFTTGTPCGTIVFIHGYDGHAIDTWRRITDCIIGDQLFTHFDIYFYGYLSKEKQPSAHLIEFKFFLKKLAAGSDEYWPTAVKEYREQSGKTDCERLVIMAHSLGSVLARLSVCQAQIAGDDWYRKTSLLLWGPADHGSQVAKGMQQIRLVARTIYEYYRPAIPELRMEAGTLVKALDDAYKSDDIIDKQWQLPRSKLFGKDDLVVKIKYYDWEIKGKIEEEPFKTKNHTDICKYDYAYTEPLTRLKSVCEEIVHDR